MNGDMTGLKELLDNIGKTPRVLSPEILALPTIGGIHFDPEDFSVWLMLRSRNGGSMTGETLPNIRGAEDFKLFLRDLCTQDNCEIYRLEINGQKVELVDGFWV